MPARHRTRSKRMACNSRAVIGENAQDAARVLVAAFTPQWRSPTPIRIEHHETAMEPSIAPGLWRLKSPQLQLDQNCAPSRSSCDCGFRLWIRVHCVTRCSGLIPRQGSGKSDFTRMGDTWSFSTTLQKRVRPAPVFLPRNRRMTIHRNFLISRSFWNSH